MRDSAFTIATVSVIACLAFLSFGMGREARIAIIAAAVSFGIGVGVRVVQRDQETKGREK